MANIPSNIGYGIVVGQFASTALDTSDPGREPDIIPVQGTVIFTPKIDYVRNISASPNPITLLKVPFIGILDHEGYLCNTTIDPETGFYERGLPLIATDDEDINPSEWTYQVSYNFNVNGRAIVTPPTHSIGVPAGATIDLTTVGTVASSTGVANVRGPANTLSIGTVTTGPTGSVTITGESPNQVINIVLPEASDEQKALAIAMAIVL
jgi:hypothetical protein